MDSRKRARKDERKGGWWAAKKRFLGAAISAAVGAVYFLFGGKRKRDEEREEDSKGKCKEPRASSVADSNFEPESEMTEEKLIDRLKRNKKQRVSNQAETSFTKEKATTKEKKKETGGGNAYGFCMENSHRVQCEEFKKRGNEHYSQMEYASAIQSYDEALHIAAGHSCNDPFFKQIRTLCHANKAMVRMKMEDYAGALKDCREALSVDPGFCKAKIRAAQCFLKCGLAQEAMAVCSDIETEGLKAEVEKINQEAKPMEEIYNECRGSISGNDVPYHKALESIQKLLDSTPCSIIGIQLRAILLLKKHSFQEAEDYYRRVEPWLSQVAVYFGSDESPNASTSSPSQPLPPLPVLQSFSFLSSMHAWCKTWLLVIHGRVCFGKGNLDLALTVLQEAARVMSSFPGDMPYPGFESDFNLEGFISEIQALQTMKTSANKLFSEKKYSDAVQGYSSALASPVAGQSPVICSVLFNNRATALQHLGQPADAIDDCDCALALNPDYEKALSKRMELSRSVRDFEQEASDLEKLISCWEMKLKSAAGTSVLPPGYFTTQLEVEKYKKRLESVKESARQNIPPDYYLILGANANDSAGQIKKAYFKTSLKHHPDKVKLFIPRVDSEAMKEVLERLETSRNRYFKMLKRGYDLLSNPETKSKFDMEEKTRNGRVSGYYDMGSTSRNVFHCPSSNPYQNPYPYYQPPAQWPYQNKSPPTSFYGSNSHQYPYH